MSKNAKLALPVDMRRSRVVLVKLPIFTNVTLVFLRHESITKGQPACKKALNEWEGQESITAPSPGPTQIPN